MAVDSSTCCSPAAPAGTCCRSRRIGSACIIIARGEGGARRSNSSQERSWRRGACSPTVLCRQRVRPHASLRSPVCPPIAWSSRTTAGPEGARGAAVGPWQARKVVDGAAEGAGSAPRPLAATHPAHGRTMDRTRCCLVSAWSGKAERGAAERNHVQSVSHSDRWPASRACGES
jgi:hypothetical protein